MTRLPPLLATASAVLFAVLATGGILCAQSPVPLVLAGDSLPDGGTVTGIRFVEVDYFGDWSAQVTTDLSNYPTLVLKSGAPWKAVGSPVQFPEGTTIAAFDSISAELFGGLIWNARLDGTPGGTEDDEALFYESKLWMQEGPLNSYLNTNLPHGTRWLSFNDVQASSANGVVMLRGRIDDPTLSGASESILAQGYMAGAPGLLVAMDRIVSAGQLAPTLSERIQSVRLAPDAASIAPGGGRLLWSCDLRGDPKVDGCVFRYISGSAVHLLLAREGDPSPVAGRTWGPLEELAVDINSNGKWTIRAALDDSDLSNDALIVKNGQVLAREGDAPAAVAPDVVDGLGRGPALVGDNGKVVWYAHLSGPGGPSEALFLDNQLLVRTGVTMIGGRLLEALSPESGSLALAPLDDLLVFRGTLAGAVEGAFSLDLSSLDSAGR